MMLTQIASLFSSYGPLPRRWFWRKAYNSLNRYFMELDWYFLNYGYAPADPKYQPPFLQATDEADRLFIQLYEATVGDLPISGLNVLEVGCGRGGGSSYLARYRKPQYVLGVDRSEQAVNFCRRHHHVPNLSFERGDSEALSQKDISFDLVINVESSHCYGSIDRFVAEVARVLKPGGHFVWADFRNRKNMDQTERAFAMKELKSLARVDITDDVVRALDEIHERKLRAIEEKSPKLFIPTLREFAAAKESTIYREFKERRKIYLIHRFRRV